MEIYKIVAREREREISMEIIQFVDEITIFMEWNYEFMSKAIVESDVFYTKSASERKKPNQLHSTYFFFQFTSILFWWSKINRRIRKLLETQLAIKLTPIEKNLIFFLTVFTSLMFICSFFSLFLLFIYV